MLGGRRRIGPWRRQPGNARGDRRVDEEPVAERHEFCAQRFHQDCGKPGAIDEEVAVDLPAVAKGEGLDPAAFIERDFRNMALHMRDAAPQGDRFQVVGELDGVEVIAVGHVALVGVGVPRLGRCTGGSKDALYAGPPVIAVCAAAAKACIQPMIHHVFRRDRRVALEGMEVLVALVAVGRAAKPVAKKDAVFERGIGGNQEFAFLNAGRGKERAQADGSRFADADRRHVRGFNQCDRIMRTRFQAQHFAEKTGRHPAGGAAAHDNHASIWFVAHVSFLQPHRL